MPKDYRSRKKSRASYQSSVGGTFAWVIFGLLIGLFAAIMGYWKWVLLPAKQQAVATTTQPVRQAQPAATKEKQAPPAAKTPEFDFYTVLPKMQTATLRMTPAKTTAAAPPVAPPAAVAAAPPPAAAPAPAPVSTPAPVVAAPSNPVMPVAPAKQTVPLVTAPPVAVKPQPAPPLQDTEKKITPTPAKAVVEAAVQAAPAETNSAAPAHYLVQIGATKSYAEADRLKAELTMLGLDVTIQPYTRNGQVYSRVVMGPYLSKAAALQQRAVLQKSHVSSAVIKLSQ